MSELRSCVKIGVDVLGSPSIMVPRTVSVDVKQYQKKKIEVAVLGSLSSIVRTVSVGVTQH